MKKFIILFFLSMSVAQSGQFELMPLIIDFNGSVVSGNNIIAYGNFGAYLLSADNGMTWKQYTINIKGEIVQMINDEDCLWGITDNGYIIQSLDNGLNWKKTKIDLTYGNRLISICLNDSHVFIRSLDEIFCFDKKLNLIKQISDEKFRLPVNYYFFYKDIFIYDTLLLVNTFYNDSPNVLLFNDNLDFFKLIKFKDSLKTEYGVIKGIYKYHNNDVIQIDNNFYQFNLDFSSLKNILSEPSVFDNSVNPFLSLPSLTINNDRILVQAFTQNNNIKIPKVYGYSYRNSDISVMSINSQDSLYAIGKKFVNNFYSKDDNYETWDGIMGALYKSKITVFQDSVFIIAGKKKTILISSDKGETWKLVSHIPYGRPVFITSENIIYFVKDNSENLEISRSIDNGTTFIPSKIKDSISYFQNFSKLSLFNIDEKGNGFFTGWKQYNDKKNNFGSTTDSGQSYSFPSCNELSIFSKDLTQSNLCQVTDGYIFSINYPIYPYYYYLYTIDTNNKEVKLLNIDSSYIHLYIMKADENQLLLISSFFDSSMNKKNVIVKSSDYCKSVTTLMYLNENFSLSNFFLIGSDSLVFTAKDEDCFLLLYDIKRNLIDTIFKSPYNTTDLTLFKLKDEYYLKGDNFLFKNQIQGDFRSWIEIEWISDNFSSGSILAKGNLAILGLNDTEMDFNYYKLNIDSEPSVVKENGEIKYYTNHFFAYAPYPIPASNSVSCKIVWDMSFNIYDSCRGVFDIYGNQIDTKFNIEFDKQQDNIANLRWNCSSINSGTYFIVFSSNGRNSCIPILIEK